MTRAVAAGKRSSHRKAVDFSIEWGARTDIGKVREHNEDAFVLLPLSAQRKRTPKTHSRTGVFLAVCDGLGGAAAGEVASGLASSVLQESIQRATREELKGDEASTLLRGAVRRANQHIYQEATAKRELAGMGTTVSAALLCGPWMTVAHVGDSRLYLWRKGGLKQITKDQSLAAALVDLGVMTAEQTAVLPGLNTLLQAVGTEDQIEVAIHQVALALGDVLLLCTDGLTAVVSHAEITKMLAADASCDRIARRLVARACAAGGPDNITVIVARVSNRRTSASRTRAGQ